MNLREKWDAVAIVSAILCVGPEVVTTVHVGLPSDVAWLELLLLLPISAILLGMPQLIMLGLILAAQSKWLRLIYLAASAAMLGYYTYRLVTGDLSSSSTAAVGLFFIGFYLALASAAAGGVLLAVERLLVRTQ